MKVNIQSLFSQINMILSANNDKTKIKCSKKSIEIKGSTETLTAFETYFVAGLFKWLIKFFTTKNINFFLNNKRTRDIIAIINDDDDDEIMKNFTIIFDGQKNEFAFQENRASIKLKSSSKFHNIRFVFNFSYDPEKNTIFIDPIDAGSKSSLSERNK